MSFVPQILGNPEADLLLPSLCWHFELVKTLGLCQCLLVKSCDVNRICFWTEYRDVQTQHYSVTNLPSGSPFPASLSVVPNSPPGLVLQSPSLFCEVLQQNKNQPNMPRMGGKGAFHVAVIRRCSELITWHFFPDSQCCQYWLVGLSRAHCRSRMSCWMDRLSAGWLHGVGAYWAHLRLENNIMSLALPWRHSQWQAQQGPGVRSVPEQQQQDKSNGKGNHDL